MNKPLLAHYLQQCHAGLILRDEAQIAALNTLQQIYDALVISSLESKSFFARFRKGRHPKGAYIVGGVGIGKTFLMNSFYHLLPFPEKLRAHFHAFMQSIHDALIMHRYVKNPLTLIAKEIATKYRVLCLDEFIVTDIVDAMLLARLLHALFDEGICLLATSNTAPDDLYLGGLQRVLFLPAIQLIKHHTTTLYLSTDKDYREQIANNRQIDPNYVAHHINMEKAFLEMAQHDPIQVLPIYINHRWIPIKQSTATMIWFDFSVICAPPRNQHDYLKIIDQYKIIFVSDIPFLSSKDKNKLALFIRFIDILYDANITLFYSTNVPANVFFDCANFPKEYARTCSRLKEMRHIPPA